MQRLIAVILAILLLWSAVCAGYAAEERSKPPATAAPAKVDDRLPIHKQDHWQFIVSPYLWVPGLNARTTVGGNTSYINEGWWDMVPKLFSNAFGVMGRVEAWKGKWGFFLDNYFVYMGGNVSASAGRQIQLGPGPRTVLLSGDLKYIARAGNLDFGVRYLVGTVPLNQSGKPLPLMSFELLGGGRFNWYNQYLRLGVTGTFAEPFLDISRSRAVTSHFRRTYVEPFLGLRLGFWLTGKAVFTFRGTVGGFGFMNDHNLDSDMELAFGYRVHRNMYAYVGYRGRYDQFSRGELSFSGWVHGPVLGAAFVF